MRLITKKATQLEEIQASIEKNFPDLKVELSKSLLGKYIKIKKTNLAGLQITYKNDVIELVEIIPNPWIAALSRQFGLVGILLTKQIKKQERSLLMEEVKLHLNLNF